MSGDEASAGAVPAHANQPLSDLHPPGTSQRVVQDVLAAVAELDHLDVAEHPHRLEALHAQLRDVLAATQDAADPASADPASADPSPTAGDAVAPDAADGDR